MKLKTNLKHIISAVIRDKS